MTEVLKGLDREYIEFICAECGITEEELLGMNDDDLYEKVYDVMCDIECAETPSGDEPLTKRGEMVEYVVTELGNALDDGDEPDVE